MTPLADRITDIIRQSGPITVERYWNLALFDPRDGYYARRDPFGRSGDFVTAPEVSQMFGELIGAWTVAAWRALGAPSPFLLAEIGPGRGTLTADILRTARTLDRDMMKAARVRLMETSDRLARLQAERLAGFDLPIRHLGRLEEAEALPIVLVANELFDAVAIRQLVFAPDGWQERHVANGETGLVFTAAAAEGVPAAFLDRLGAPEPGTVFEVSPGRAAIADAVARRLVRDGGAALMIDYGHAVSGFGDTLQAVRSHAFADPLAEPGLADLTSHVDFGTLAARFRAAGAAVAPIMEQGEFLLRLGLRERAGVVGRDKSPSEQAAIVAAAKRLAGSDRGDMGTLFKVLAASSVPLPLPPFGDA